MREPFHPMSPGGSAPVAIVLALALAATVGVSAQSWDAKVVVKPAAGAARSSEARAQADHGDGGGVTLLARIAAAWSGRGRPAGCSDPGPLIDVCGVGRDGCREVRESAPRACRSRHLGAR